jgi:hypothetical protein
LRPTFSFLRRLGEIRNRPTTDLIDKYLGMARNRVRDGDLKADSDQPRGHRSAHIADPDKANALDRIHAHLAAPPGLPFKAPSATSTSCAALKASSPAGMPEYTVACSKISLISSTVTPLVSAPLT